MFTSFTFQCPL